VAQLITDFAIIEKTGKKRALSSSHETRKKMLNTISTFPLASAFPIFYFPTAEDMATPVSMQIVESTPKDLTFSPSLSTSWNFNFCSSVLCNLD
jgi:hypothetical protein